MRSALIQAAAWGYIDTNPALFAKPPIYKPAVRSSWTAEEARRALELCTDPILRPALILALGCSMRIGEILGLTWDCVDISSASIAAQAASVKVTKELKRCNKDCLADLERHGRSDVFLTFPELKTRCSTALVLKKPKTDSSRRTIYISDTVIDALRDIKKRQTGQRELLGDGYSDYGLVIAHEDGRPYEERQIADLLQSFIREHNLPSVVFRSLRHTSTSIKLVLSNGDIKSVQGDTGHSQARMVTDQYAAIDNGSRRRLSQKVESDFFRLSPAPVPSDDICDSEDIAEALKVLRTNPDLAKLILAVGKRSPQT